jgi:hypothetical protein
MQSSFSLLTEVHPIIETFPLEQVTVAYESMMNAEVRFRVVIITLLQNIRHTSRGNVIACPTLWPIFT